MNISKTTVKLALMKILLPELGKLNVLGKTIKKIENEIRTELFILLNAGRAFNFN